MAGTKKFNLHLAVVFEEILPVIDKAGFKYWVFGGVAVAGVIGKFIRTNDDVDVYVLEENFEDIRHQLELLCQTHAGWGLRNARPKKRTGRPKFDIHINKHEILSVIPVYKTAKGVEFRVTGVELLPTDQTLTQEHRFVDGFSFFSPPQNIIKAIFKSFILDRQGIIINDPKRRMDAQALFSKQEFSELKELSKPTNNV